jgi:SH3-like domain-containing protein
MTAAHPSAVTRILILTLLVVFACAGPARAAEEDPPPGPASEQGRGGPETSGLPLPRFASLRAGEVNVRTGPGVQYPIDWVFQRQGLPVEVIAEYRTWRKIRDWQGTQGWVHQSLLAGKRTVIVVGGTRTLASKPEPDAGAVAHLEAGVVANLVNCPEGSAWCRIEVDGFDGWLRRVDFWGVLKDETTEAKRSLRPAR